MAIIIKSGLDPTGVKEGTAAAQTALKGDINGALQSVQAKAQEAEKSLKGMLDIGKIQSFSGALGTMKTLVNQATTSLGLFSKETAKAVSSTIDFAKQGAELGSKILPGYGTAIGAVVGGIYGYIDATDAAEEATRKLAKAIKDKQDQDIKIAKDAQDKAQGKGQDAFTESFETLNDLNTRADELRGKLTYATDEVSKNLRKNIAQVQDDARLTTNAIEGLKLENDRLAAITSQDVEDRERLRKLTEENTEKIKVKQQELNEETAKANDLIKKGNDLFEVVPDKISKATSAVKTHTSAVTESAKALAELNKQSLALLQTLATSTPKTEAFDRFMKAQSGENVGGRGIKDEVGSRDNPHNRDDAQALHETMVDLGDDLPIPQLKAMDFALFNIKQKAKEVGEELQKGLVDVGVAGAEKFFDNIEKGNRALDGTGKVLERAAAEQLKSIGKMLIAEGIHNELRAAAIGILSLGVDPQAYALAGLGAAEIAAGLAMGAGGALLGRRAGQGSAGVGSSTQRDDSLGSRESEVSGPRKLGDIKVFLGPEHGITLNADSSDRRAITLLGQVLDTYQAMARKAPR